MNDWYFVFVQVDGKTTFEAVASFASSLEAEEYFDTLDTSASVYVAKNNKIIHYKNMDR